MAGTGPMTGSSGRLKAENPVIFQSDASFSQAPSEVSCVTYVDDYSYTQPSKPSASEIVEICGLLQVKTSSLAIGACERVRKLAKAHPADVIASPILGELLRILEGNTAVPLANGAMLALSTIALVPEGRQQIVLSGAVPNLVRLLLRCDFTRPNLGRGVQLIMNLAADSQNRRVIREAGGCEALAVILRTAPMEAIMEHAMGALHNIMLTDSKAKTRAVDGGVAFGLARVLAAKLEDGNSLAVRARMLVADLLRVPDIQQRLVAAADELNLRIPGMMPARRITSQSHSSCTSPARPSQLGAPPAVESHVGPAAVLAAADFERPASTGSDPGALPQLQALAV